MTTTTRAGDDRATSGRPAKVLGHLALYYRPGEESAARTLLTDLGFELVDNGPRPGEDGFCSGLVDGATANHHDNVVYLAAMGEAQWALEQQVAEALATDTGSAFRDRMGEWPESAPHVGVKYESLDDLEATLAALDRHTAPGGPLEGRVTVTRFRARPGLDPDVDARMAASPVFTDDDRPAFGDHIVQCFVRTDLFGALTSASTIELDYAFAPFYGRIPTFGR
jgi:hypothetical protein